MRLACALALLAVTALPVRAQVAHAGPAPVHPEAERTAAAAQAPPPGSGDAPNAAPLQVRPRPLAPRAGSPLLLDVFAGDCALTAQALRRDHTTVTLTIARDARVCATGGTRLLRPQAASSLRWGRSGVYRIRIEDDGGPGGAARLLHFELVQVGQARSDVWPEAGYWWNESGGEFDTAGPGMGLQLERQGDTLSATVLGYADDGRPEWLVGAAAIDGMVARIPLLRLQDGRGPFGGWRAPGEAAPAGVLHLEFLSAARAVAWFQRPRGAGIEVWPVSLVRFRFDQQQGSALLGDWLLLAAGDRQAQPLTLQTVDSTPAAVRLGAAEAGQVLECTLDAARPNSPPGRCVLQDASGALQVDFTDVALDRMVGFRPDGVQVHAIRRPGN